MKEIHEEHRLVLTFITGILQMDPAALNGVDATKTDQFREQAGF